MKESKELEVVELMIRLYCAKKHKFKDGLCADCNELLEYVKLRRSKCPWGDNKPFYAVNQCRCVLGNCRFISRTISIFYGIKIR